MFRLERPLPMVQERSMRFLAPKVRATPKGIRRTNFANSMRQVTVEMARVVNSRIEVNRRSEEDQLRKAKRAMAKARRVEALLVASLLKVRVPQARHLRRRMVTRPVGSG